MRRIIVIGILVIVVLLLVAQFGPSLVHGETVRPASPIFGVTIPDGYRDWKMIAVAHEAGLDELRGVVGNDVAVKAYEQSTLPFPDGTILVKLAWKHVPVEGLEGAFVTGSATTVQVMVKDTKRYASTGGWGFGRFIDGMPVDEMQHRTCVPCHEAHVKDHDLVFTRFAR
jgi:hypothetical protein